MQINFKQVEIEDALKAYVAQQGINISGKVVEVTFISGRKNNGLTAELNIQDAAITERRHVSLTKEVQTPVAENVTETKPEPVLEVIQEPTVTPEVTEPPPKTVSLFS